MEKRMVECEDGREREARVFGFPRVEGDFEILPAGIRLKGKHVYGEAWHDRKSGIWYFLTGTEGKNKHLLPRGKVRPYESSSQLFYSHFVRTE